MLNRSKFTALLLLAVVFLAGAAVGGAASAALADRPERERERRERPSYLDRLDRELTLTPAQRDTIALILGDYQTATRELWQEMRPRFDAIRQDIRAQVSALLDSTQRDAYRAFVTRSDSIRAARERGDSAR